MLIKNVNVVLLDKVINANVEIVGSKFKKITPTKKPLSSSTKYMLPGYIESHSHGGYGFDFNSIANKNFTNLDNYFKSITSEGVTSIIATTVTCSQKDLIKISNNFNDFLKYDKNNIVLGWFAEGPYISKAKKGAHNEKFITPVNMKTISYMKSKFKDEKLVIAIAPEISKNMSSIKKIVNKNTFVSVGHSNCSAKEAIQANKLGASRIIHLYNQTSGFHHREPGIVNAVFLNIPIYSEMICDKYHVDPIVMKNTYDAIGSDKLIIVTDCLSCKGLKNGNYMLGSLPVVKKDTVCFLRDNQNVIAGSILPYNLNVKNLYEVTKCSLIDIMKMSSYNSAKSLKVDHYLGLIKEGYQADFVITDKNLNLKETYKLGKKVY